MSNAQWFLLVGCLLIATGLASARLRRLPVTSAMLYLLVGLVFGPTLLGAYHFNPLQESGVLEALTEAAVLISLFAAGVKMPVPVSLARWRTPILLATGSMVITVGLIAAFVHLVLGLPLGAAVLLGAILAPTDPVLATEVQTRHPGDRDRLRFYLTCEAGMNDGTAFPFVMLGMGLLGLHELGGGGRWLLVDLLWATLAGVATGALLGGLLGRVAGRMRDGVDGHGVLDDFLGLGLIGVVYGVAELIHAWGFLAVFSAAVSLRQTEHRLCEAGRAAASGTAGPPCRVGMPGGDGARDGRPTVSEGSLVFKEHLERLSEVLLVLLVGGSLFLDSWSWRAVGVAAFVFLVARPVSVLVGLGGSRLPWGMRAMLAWFGVRGIGSLYYLVYAIQHGLPEQLALELVHLTLVVVALSILIHGVSARPLMDRFRRRATLQGTRDAGRTLDGMNTAEADASALPQRNRQTDDHD